MKTLIATVLFCCLTLGTFASKQENELLFKECCSSYMFDEDSGEPFEAVTVCVPGNGAATYALACVKAEGIRDAFLALP